MWRLCETVWKIWNVFRWFILLCLYRYKESLTHSGERNLRCASYRFVFYFLQKKKKKTKEKVAVEPDECESPAPKKRKSEKILTEFPDVNGNTDIDHIKVTLIIPQFWLFFSQFMSLFLAIPTFFPLRIVKYKLAIVRYKVQIVRYWVAISFIFL